MEKYFYGQGKVYLAKRDINGNPLAFRWVGDVSELTFELSTEDVTHKESYSGTRSTVRKFNIGKDGTLNAVFHDHSPANLALLLYGAVIENNGGNVTGEKLPEGIVAGERYALKHQNVKTVNVDGLTQGEDYEVDAVFGAITFLETPTTQPLTVNYVYAANRNTPEFTKNPEDLFFRYEGINLAENGEPVVAELYKVQFSPTAGLSLINNDSSLGGLDVSAAVLLDTARSALDELGQYGRIVNVATDEEIRGEHEQE